LKVKVELCSFELFQTLYWLILIKAGLSGDQVSFSPC